MKEPKDYIIFPLDFPTYDEAMSCVDILRGHVGLFKVGLELFISQGPEIVKAVREAGNTPVFLDLKLHDIPATVKRAFLAACRYNPEFITVHCDEGSDILRSIADDNPGDTKILAVTLLTSLNREKLRELGYAERYAGSPSRLVLLKARIARQAGCHGIVCSGREVAMVKNEFGDELTVVTPGIRPDWSFVAKDDQARVVTPGRAVESGADYVVVGRPIREAANPAEAAKRVAEEIASVLS